jgi:hypothetical protein
MNLLSMGAAYGVIVAVYQWGWLPSIFGVSRTGVRRGVGSCGGLAADEGSDPGFCPPPAGRRPAGW